MTHLEFNLLALFSGLVYYWKIATRKYLQFWNWTSLSFCQEHVHDILLSRAISVWWYSMSVFSFHLHEPVTTDGKSVFWLVFWRFWITSRYSFPDFISSCYALVHLKKENLIKKEQNPSDSSTYLPFCSLTQFSWLKLGNLLSSKELFVWRNWSFY